MLRPEQMSKVSVTGSRDVMSEVIETIHELNLVHLSNYDGSWEGFEPGNPIEGAEEVSDKLVTIRSIESILDVQDEDAGPQRIVTDDALDDELEDIRTKVNTLDDKQNELQDELRSVEDRIDSMEPFAELGIDLDLLSGYDSLQVAVGEGNTDEIEQTLRDADDIQEFELFTGGRTVAIFAYPTDDADEDALDDALVGVDFASFEVPDASGSPEEYVSELRHERQKLESKLDGVEKELHDVKLDGAGFLLAAEEKLSIEVQKAEAPLQFATTENAFIAEGWIPTEKYNKLASDLDATVGDHVEVDELRRADYEEGHPHTVTEEAEEVATTDGGHVVDDDEQPPVVQDNPGPVKPFELLVETINRPRYFEFDPSVILFLTFPIFFGFMIGDLGYGLLYLAFGYAIYSKTSSLALKSLGGIALWAGLFTAIFGVLYGEIFGLHILGETIYGEMGPPIKKGLQPANAEYASTWLVLSLLIGLAHLTLGYLFGFFEELSHGFKDALLHKGSWIILMLGVWVWIFSKQMMGPKPPFLFEVFNGSPFALGFAGFPASVGTIALAVAAVGLVLMIAGEVSELGGPGALIGTLESLKSLSDVISYTRIAAVLLAKAGMAFVINLLFFGAYEHHDEWHFMLSYGPSYVNSHYEGASIIFPGLMHSGVAGVLVGLLILVVGHLLVLALGVTSAGLQAVRLEYVEFFGKFYQGGGEEYEPFGYERTHTTQD
ncbi:V/A-type H+-transporting ATPase subunit I [Haladaptatus litoreus]|uniref:A-type ATP synthase subunit I n=1 Tax=Haladaptatus litoreus TaxID=553468 RepID=A0A1N7BUJ1_9EURY|nr:V-type ATP synthase subunit I [Haladaptatus litoreus]SIR54970.1 V/A-type H+-transporting ATPase subunit I [Haladaptatus litoreus]